MPVLGLGQQQRKDYLDLLHDPMTETISNHIPDLGAMFAEHSPAPLGIVDSGDSSQQGRRAAIEEVNKSLGLALDDSELEYLVDAYGTLSRPPTDIEVGQSNAAMFKFPTLVSSRAEDSRDCLLT